MPAFLVSIHSIFGLLFLAFILVLINDRQGSVVFILFINNLFQDLVLKQIDISKNPLQTLPTHIYLPLHKASPRYLTIEELIEEWRPWIRLAAYE